MGKVKQMYEDKKTELEETTTNLEYERRKLEGAYMILNAVSKSKIVQGSNLDSAIYYLDKVIKECDIAIDINYAELDDNPLTTI
jgi:replication-associated recombination protein RarA